MLSVDGDIDAAVETRVQTGWNKFRQLVPLLTNRDISLIRRGRLYSSCAHSSMLHGNETWPVRKENEVGLFHLDMSEQLQQNTERNVIFARPLKIQRLESCQLQGALPGALPLAPTEGSTTRPSLPRYMPVMWALLSNTFRGLWSTIEVANSVQQ